MVWDAKPLIISIALLILAAESLFLFVCSDTISIVSIVVCVIWSNSLMLSEAPVEWEVIADTASSSLFTPFFSTSITPPNSIIFSFTISVSLAWLVAPCAKSSIAWFVFRILSEIFSNFSLNFSLLWLNASPVCITLPSIVANDLRTFSRECAISPISSARLSKAGLTVKLKSPIAAWRRLSSTSLMPFVILNPLKAEITNAAINITTAAIP